MYACMHVGACMCMYLHVCICACMTDGCTDGRTDGWMDVSICVCVCVWFERIMEVYATSYYECLFLHLDLSFTTLSVLLPVFAQKDFVGGRLSAELFAAGSYKKKQDIDQRTDSTDMLSNESNNMSETCLCRFHFIVASISTVLLLERTILQV